MNNGSNGKIGKDGNKLARRRNGLEGLAFVVVIGSVLVGYGVLFDWALQ